MQTPSPTPVVDTHLHFWDFANYRGHDEWLHDQPSINRNFLPPEIKAHFDACGVNKGVIIEAARTSHALNLWWLGLAEQYEYLGAVAVGCFLEQADLTDRLDEYGHSPYFVGIRTALAGPPESWIGNPATQRGLREMARRGLSLDLLVGYEAFGAVRQLAQQHPTLRVIIDHCGSPPIREGRMDAWRRELAPLALAPNVFVKYSSLLFYLTPNVALDQIRPIAEDLVSHFGAERLLWGSNWPVELLGGSYEEAFRLMRAGLEPLLSVSELAAVMGGNAMAFYQVK